MPSRFERAIPAHQNARRHIAEESALNVLVSLITSDSKEGVHVRLWGGEFETLTGINKLGTVRIT